MTRMHEGHYMDKHDTNSQPVSHIREAVTKSLLRGKLTCIAAEKIAHNHNVSMAEVGKTADLLNIKITGCQMGIFGAKDAPTLSARTSITPELVEEVQAQATTNQLTCAAAWRLADQFGRSRNAICMICDREGIKMISCQLGAF